MRFTSQPAVSRTTGILPLLGAAMIPAALVLLLVCMSLSREEEAVRMPATSVARPPAVRDMPRVTVQIDRQGAVAIAGQPITDDALPAAWRRERAALRLLGCEPSQATLIVHCDGNITTDRVQHVIAQAQAAGFQQCVLRAGGDNGGLSPSGSPGGRP